jgi:NitT/TauT family transport system substrate-binding protein
MKNALSFPLRLVLLGTLVAALLPLGGAREARGQSEGTVRLAQQYGLWCAISTIVVERKLVEKYAPGWAVEEYRFASGADLRAALGAGRVDVGISGFAPFLTGWAKGLPTKSADVMTGYKHELVTRHTDVKDIAEFVELAKSSPAFKIGAPSPGSSNHIALQWYLQRNGFDPHALDEYIVKMNHPTSMQSLVTEQIDAHLTSPPYAILEKEQGLTSLANLWPTEGGFMPNAVVVVNTDWAEEHPDTYQAVVKAFNEGAAWSVANPREAAEILAPTLKMSVEDTLAQMESEVRYDVSGVDVEEELLAYADFMHQIGLIERSPETLADIATAELVEEAKTTGQ